MDSASTNRRSPSQTFSWATLVWILSGVAFAAYGVLLARHVEAYAGGSDSSGYLNQARLLAAAQVHTPVREIAELKNHPQPAWLYAPLGFMPAFDGRGLVPTYPTGLPLMLAATAGVVGWDHAGEVVMWLHGMAGVLLMFAAARRFGLSPSWSMLGTAILAASPLYLFFCVTLMSDVPALVWATGAMLAAWQSTKQPKWAIAAGAAFAMGVLIRPTNILMIVPVAVVLGLDARRWAYLFLGGAPGAGFFFLHTRAAYGAFFTSGYGDSAQLEATWLKPTLLHYARWLPIVFTPVVVAFPAVVLLVRRNPRVVIVLTTWGLVFFGFYAAYEFTHQTWWFLRFLLPAAPALIIGALLVLQRGLAGRFPPWVAIGGFAIALAGAVRFEAGWTQKLGALDSGKGERVYRLTTAWLNEHLPQNAVVAAYQASGAIFYGTQFSVLRFDWLHADNLSALTNELQRTRRPLFAVLFRHEVEEPHVFKDNLSVGTWTCIGNVEQVSVWQWGPAAPKP